MKMNASYTQVHVIHMEIQGKPFSELYFSIKIVIKYAIIQQVMCQINVDYAIFSPCLGIWFLLCYFTDKINK